METTVVLCSVPELDINHNHTYTFNTKQAQLDFFNSRKTLVFNEVMYQKDNDSIKLDIVYGNSKLMSSNYLYFRNPDDNVIHYCFIVNKKYINENTTQLFLKLDVMQTYLVGIDYNLSDSFIERQHMNEMKSNGKPDLDVLNRPEDIEVGEYVVGNTINIYDFEQSGGYIVASTDKLSKKKARPQGSGGSSGGSSGGGGSNPGGDTLRNKIVESARKLIGKPYILGGNYPPLGSDAGTDCSGLCQWAYHDNGIDILRVTYDQVQQGTQVSGDSLQPGDLIFMYFSEAGPEHVIMFAHYNDGGGFTAIEARDESNGINEFTWTWQSDFMARRIISNSGGSSGSSSAVPQPSNPEWDNIPSNVQAFINAVYAGANAGYHQYNLFASLTIAQGGLETGWNTSPAGNNLFGIKADSSWTGKTFTSETYEDDGSGNLVQVTATFRAYDSISDSVLDRCKFLKENQRYTNAGVFTATTPEAQAQALKDAGYATDSNYVSKLTGIINNFNLKVYDI